MAQTALVAALVLAVVVAGWTRLYVDGRGQRKALRSAQSTLDGLQKRLAGQDEQIGHLTRALALLVPADARPTTALQRPAADALAAAIAKRNALAKPEASRSPDAVQRMVDEVNGKRPPEPVDVEGDRKGLNPPDVFPASGTIATPPGSGATLLGEETNEEIRARFEAEADARSEARGGLPSMATNDEPEDERTRVYTGKQRVPRPSLLRPLAGASPTPLKPNALADVPLVAPVSSASRTAEAFARGERRPSPKPEPKLEDTLPSASEDDPPQEGAVVVVALRDDGGRGRPLSDAPPAPNVGDRGTPSWKFGEPPPWPASVPPYIRERISRRFLEKVAAAEHSSEPVKHCCVSAACTGGDECACECHECGAVAKLYADAAREVLGEEQG